jgi:hypothetical protein
MSSNKKVAKINTDKTVVNSSNASAKYIDALTDVVTDSDRVSVDSKNVNDGNSKSVENDGHSANDAGSANGRALDATSTSVASAANEAELTASFPQKVRYIGGRFDIRSAHSF